MLNKLTDVLLKYILIFGVVFLSAPVQAQFNLDFQFPTQNVALNAETQVSLEISDAPAWTSGIIMITVTSVTSDSDADKLQIERQITLVAGKETFTKPIPITVLANGKYDVRVGVTLETEQRQLATARIFSVITENGQSWFGVRAGTKLTFKGEWIGHGKDKREKNIPMQGVKITVEDTTEVSLPIQGYLVDGEFTFEAPHDNYSFKIKVESKFAGITSNGSIDTLGSTIGNFDLVSTLNGYTYKRTVPSNNLLYYEFSPKNTKVPEESKMWTVFHGIVEMVQLIKQELNINKKGGFQVIFPFIGFDGNKHTDMNAAFDGNVYISSKSSLDWDMLAHEFGHVIGEEHKVLIFAYGAGHDGTNQYDYSQNEKTHHNKLGSLNLAFAEAFASWFGIVMLENSTKDFWKIGDHTENETRRYTVPPQTSGKLGAYTHIYIYENYGDIFYYDNYRNDFEVNNAGFMTIYQDNNRTLEVGDIATPTKLETTSVTTKIKGIYSYGEDSEIAISRLLWDLYDNSQDENRRATCDDCRDKTNLGLSKMPVPINNGLWDILNEGLLFNISDFWCAFLYKHVFGENLPDNWNNTYVNLNNTNDIYAKRMELCETKITEKFFKNEKGTIPAEQLYKVFDAANTFAEFGIAPYLDSVKKIKTKRDSGPTVSWSQKKTGSLPGLNKFRLVLYYLSETSEATIVFDKEDIRVPYYEFQGIAQEIGQESDLESIRNKLYELKTFHNLEEVPRLLTAVVIGETDENLYPSPLNINGYVDSGPYFSNAREVKVKCPPLKNRRGVRSETDVEEDVIYLDMDSCPVDDYANQIITRASSIAQIFNKFNIPSRFELDISFNSPPSDVDNTNPHYEYIATAYNKGIVESYTTGDLTGQYAPSNPVNRVEFIKMVLETLNKYFSLPLEAEWMQEPINILGNPFPDMDYTAWYYKYVKAAYNYRIILGTTEGNLLPNAELMWKDAEAILNRAQQYAFVAFWTGNGSIISYHGKNANLDNYNYPFGITQDKTVLHPEPNKRPVAFFQWQVSEDSCDRLKIDVENLPIAENNVDIIFGTWDSRSSDQTFENVTLPFVIGETNTGYTFTDIDSEWYMVGVAFKNPVSKSAILDATCVPEELPTAKPYITSKALMLEGSYRWNGNGSIISGMFSHLNKDSNGQWPYGVFEDVAKVHPSPEKPVVFFQWMAHDEVCPELTINVPTLSNSEKKVHIVHKVWDNNTYSVADCEILPCTLKRLKSVSGPWNVIGVAFDNPVSQTATVEAKCSVKD